MRSSRAAVMLAVTLVLATLDAAWGQGVTRTITGTVVDSANHKAVSQAEIYLGRLTTAQHTGDDGTFRVSVTAPKGQTAAVYRLVTRVREKPSNPRSYPTFTLPRGVALNSR